MPKNEEFENDFNEAFEHYGDYDLLELRREAEVMEEMARTSKVLEMAEAFRRQAYLMNLLIYLSGKRI